VHIPARKRLLLVRVPHRRASFLREVNQQGLVRPKPAGRAAIV
jgi:hypothetical protein